jgi:plasmid stability protein
MPDLLIRDLDPELLERLKLWAKQRGRSVQSEVKEILKNNTPLTMEEVRARMAEFWRNQPRRRLSDSAELIREDRER